MFRYADPTTCPVCRSTIAPGTHVCASCGTRLTGPVAESLFRTLTEADGLVAQLATLSAHSTAARTAGPAATAAPAPAGVPAGPMLPPDLPAFPAPATRPRTNGLSSASVPKILLGLGALCLLVAAVVFLAVAWALLGVGGRTAVLVLLTAAVGGLGWLLARRDLRAGAEAFAAVALGLLTLDLFGARSAGWLDLLDEPAFLTSLGAVLAVASLGWALLLRRCPTGPLATTQLVGGFGIAFGTSWLVQTVLPAAAHDLDASGASVVAWLALLLGGLAATRALHLVLASVVVVIGLGLGWLELAGVGFARIDEPTVAGVWGGFHPWPAVLAALLAAGVAWWGRPLPRPARVAAGAVAVALLSVLVVIPAVDESMSTLVVVAVVTVVLAAGASAVLDRSWRPVVAAPAAVATCGLLVAVAIAAGGTLVSLFFTAPWSVEPMQALPHAELWDLWPLLVPVAVAGLLVGAWSLARLVTDVSASTALVPALLLVAVSTVAVPTAYGVGLGVMVVLLLLAAGALGAVAAASDRQVRTTALALAALLGAVALLASLQSQPLTALTTGLLTAGAGATTLASRGVVRSAGDIVFAPAATAFLWTTLDLLDVEAAWRAIPMLVVAGAWAVLVPRVEREAAAAVAMLATLMLCVSHSGDDAQTWLAVDLTLSGVLAHLSALMHPTRRWFGWIGLGLMVAAQWVRLDQVGVETVEAYTLPLAVVLLVVGVARMRDRAMRSARALGPGLALALVPSFFVALVEPVSLRALLLGVACLAVVVAGAGLRWSAPLVAGAVVGAPLALRELTHAVTLPQWLVIGLIGLVLTVVGVTWERSLKEVRQATGFLRRLR